MTAKTPQRPSRSATGPTSPATGMVAVPSTLWAAGSKPFDPDDRWPEPILSRAVREFCVPGGRALLIGWPTPTTRGGLHVAEPDTAAALVTVAALGRHGVSEPDPGAGEPVDLVVVSLLADHFDPVGAADRVAGLGVERLAMGGLLVVLGRCRHSGEGVLVDPAGAVVAAAQAADLLYLQHIIAVPVTGHTITATAAADALAPSAGRHVVAHADVFVFLQPSAQD
ncbi:hypothetical protein [Nocardia nepalensis]|uniref:hypothetical protein n=1 Tax=Nocardia nepalensis TaxID=3375448 RepID=UPI003B680001